MDNPLCKNKNQLFRELFSSCGSENFPIIKSTKYQENYFSIKLKKDDICFGTFIVGPSTYSSISSENIDSIISVNNISISYKRELINYFNSISVFDSTKLLNSSLLLYYSIYNKKLNITEVIEGNSTLRNITINIKDNLQSNISKNRQETLFHHSQKREKIMIQAIKTGNSEKILEYFQNPSDGDFGILSKTNPLRGERNLLICIVTIATRAAIEGGLDSETAYTLSDLYIQKIEEIHEIIDLSALHTNMLCDFTDRVKNVKAHKYSNYINLCMNNISKHLYDKTSIFQLAEDVDLNPNYLSELFKKEVGITISHYIQREKIEEAKRLLTSSTYPILDISTWLNFHDQSHFTRIFKKFTGTTPKKYRENSTC